MKYRNIIIDYFKSAPYFTKGAVFQIGEQYKLKRGTIDAYINRAVAKKELVRLKRGVYVTTAFYDVHKNDISYTFFLANILRSPSYVSSWTALQYYDLATEAIYSTISITSKVTRKYENKAGNYMYHSLKKDLFSGYTLVKDRQFDFFIATPWKALFDLVYLKTHQLRGITLEEVDEILHDLRIDTDDLSQEDKKAFYSLIKKHI